jgi:hypothetical protein
MIRKKLNQERGNVVVTAILLVSVMLGLGLTVASQVDTQTTQSRKERERESSFNLAEASLSAQTFILGRLGTGTEVNPYPEDGCERGSTLDFCPDEDQLMRSYDGHGQVDFNTETTWVTHVLDDATPDGEPVRFWKDEFLDTEGWERYDKYGGIHPTTGAAVPNRHVWVRAEAEVRGHKRAIVAWVKIEDRVISFPNYAVLAGWVDGKNSGGHGGRPLVNSTGSLGVAVRCTTSTGTFPPQDENCVDLNPVKGPQIQPPTAVTLNDSSPSAIGGDELAALEDMARANGTLYEGCPANPNGDVVYVKNAGECRYTNDAPAAAGATKCCNLEENPGLYIVERGTVDFGGNIEFWGVVYNANLDNSSSQFLVETSGTAAIHGGALVDGPGGVYAGSSGDNIVYYALSFEDIRAVGTAGVVQNTWREIVPADIG